MGEERWIDLGHGCRIPLSDLSFSFSRSSGPGGQNVNKVNTRVSLTFDLERSPWLDRRQRARIRSRLGNRINREGILRISAGEQRSQKANREAVLARFRILLQQALREEKERKATRIPARARERRLREKKRRSLVKRLRSQRPGRQE